jgi:PAS domain-containing protein
LETFPKNDVGILKKYVALLQREGRSFEDILSLKGGKRSVCVYGSRINGADNNLYCDIIWFRDITEEADKIVSLENEKAEVAEKTAQLQNMIDGLDYPLWLRDEHLHLVAVNKKYLDFTGQRSKDVVLSANIEISDSKGDTVAKNLAEAAQKSKKTQKKALNIVRGGELYNFELYETPYFIGDVLDRIGTIGYMTDNTELEKAKRNFKINQNNHLEILGALGTAFAIFDRNTNLYFYNTSFRNLWGLENEFLEKTPTYQQFLDVIRENKMLPPVPDFKSYKEDENAVFSGLLETKEDLLHLPDGRTIRRLRTPHPNGVIFAFEDVSDRLATMRRLNDLTSIQQSILDNLNDAVVIFGANQRLKFFNSAYLKLWGLDYEKLTDEPKLDAVISWQKLFFSDVDDWNEFKKSMMVNIMDERKFNLSRDDNVNIAVSPLIFYDGSIMITYTVKHN